MVKKKFLHEHDDFRAICEAARDETKASLQIVEKDYWVMHVIWSLSQCGFDFELKGGTSLSKGWELISRFSEDVDIFIHPPKNLKVYTGPNHDKTKHIESRNEFFDWLSVNTKVYGATGVERDPGWDDSKARNCGIKVLYSSIFSRELAIKPFVLLEAGFAQVEPNESLVISSWVMDIAQKAGLDIVDNRATNVRCYLPEYTFVEKLSAVSNKYKQEQANKILPANFIRHYYDLHNLLLAERIQKFIGTLEYAKHKEKMKLNKSGYSIAKDEAFLLSDPKTRARYEQEYNLKAPMYYKNRPTFSEIISGIKANIDKL